MDLPMVVLVPPHLLFDLGLAVAQRSSPSYKKYVCMYVCMYALYYLQFLAVQR